MLLVEGTQKNGVLSFGFPSKPPNKEVGCVCFYGPAPQKNGSSKNSSPPQKKNNNNRICFKKKKKWQFNKKTKHDRSYQKRGALTDG